jgi:hypothetical protein
VGIVWRERERRWGLVLVRKGVWRMSNGKLMTGWVPIDLNIPASRDSRVETRLEDGIADLG